MYVDEMLVQNRAKRTDNMKIVEYCQHEIQQNQPWKHQDI